MMDKETLMEMEMKISNNSYRVSPKKWCVSLLLQQANAPFFWDTLYIICKTFIITQYAFTQLYFEFAPSIDFVDTPGVMRIA